MTGDGVHVDLLPMDVRIWGSQRLDDLWRNNQSLLDHEDASVVVVDTRVVRA